MQESTSTPTPTVPVPVTPTKKNKRAAKKGNKTIVVNRTEGLSLVQFMDSKHAISLGFRAATKYWAEFGASTKNRGFRANLYRELAKRNLSAEQTLDFAKKNGGSDNDIKQISHFQTISALIAEVRGETKKAKRPAASKVKKDASSDKKAVAAS